jgi:hypothetical protein
VVVTTAAMAATEASGEASDRQPLLFFIDFIDFIDIIDFIIMPKRLLWSVASKKTQEGKGEESNKTGGLHGGLLFCLKKQTT